MRGRWSPGACEGRFVAPRKVYDDRSTLRILATILYVLVTSHLHLFRLFIAEHRHPHDGR